jgi:putative transposase
MVIYRRNLVPGGTYFFTVTLTDRRSSVLVDHIGMLRTAFRVARRERPFTIDAIEILPDHLHAILTLPEGDADYSGRWRRIKGYFSSQIIAKGLFAGPTESLLCGKDDIGSTRSATMPISADTQTRSISIRSGTDW